MTTTAVGVEAPQSLYVRTCKPPSGLNYQRLSARELMAVYSQWMRYASMYRTSRLDNVDFREYLNCSRELLARLEKGSPCPHPR